MSWWWLLVPASFVLGGFSTAAMIGRATGHDPRAEGSGNPGASNMYRVAGRRAGVLVLAGDLIKGFVPAAIGTAADGRALGLACGLAAMVGHIAPPTRGLRGGGKGVATLGGACWFLYPWVAVAALVVWGVMMRLFRMASLGSIAMATVLPIGVAIGGRAWWEVAATAAASALVVYRHSPNIGRIVRGEERSVTGS